MNKTILLLTFLVCCFYNASAQRMIEAEEYEVYKAVLGEGKNVVSNFTVNDDALNYLIKNRKKELSFIESETRKSYNARNRNSAQLQNNFGKNVFVSLIADKDLKEIYDKLGENKYELTIENELMAKYGSATLITLSRVGFNKNKTQALLGINANTGLCGTCSISFYYILKKENDNWTITKRVMSSIS